MAARNAQRGSQVTLFLWRKAHAEHYKECVGSVLLLWTPQVRRDGAAEGGGSGYSLHVDKPEGLQRVGVSTDFAFCKGKRKVGAALRVWVCGGGGGGGGGCGASAPRVGPSPLHAAALLPVRVGTCRHPRSGLGLPAGDAS